MLGTKPIYEEEELGKAVSKKKEKAGECWEIANELPGS